MISDDLRERLRAEIQRQGRKMKELSLAAGLSESYVRDALDRGRGSVGNLIRVAAQLGHSPGWVLEVSGSVPSDRPQPTGQAATSSKKSPRAERPNASGIEPPPTYGAPLPVLGVSRGGEDGTLIFNGEVIETIPRPPDLEGISEAYGSYVLGDSMYPRFKEGDRVWVHPRRPARRGNDVVVQITGDDPQGAPLGFIKEYVGFSGGKLVLKQFNPAKEIEFDRQDVVSVHVIVGTLFR